MWDYWSLKSERLQQVLILMFDRSTQLPDRNNLRFDVNGGESPYYRPNSFADIEEHPHHKVPSQLNALFEEVRSPEVKKIRLPRSWRQCYELKILKRMTLYYDNFVTGSDAVKDWEWLWHRYLDWIGRRRLLHSARI